MKRAVFAGKRLLRSGCETAAICLPLISQHLRFVRLVQLRAFATSRVLSATSWGITWRNKEDSHSIVIFGPKDRELLALQRQEQELRIQKPYLFKTGWRMVQCGGVCALAHEGASLDSSSPESRNNQRQCLIHMLLWLFHLCAAFDLVTTPTATAMNDHKLKKSVENESVR